MWRSFSVKEITYAEMLNFSSQYYPSATSGEQIEQHPDYYYFRAYDKRKKGIGTLILYRYSRNNSYSGDAWMYRIWVHPGYRRLGVGDALNDLALKKAKSLNCKELYVSINKDNKASLSIAEKLGMHEREWSSLRADYQEYLKQKEMKEVILSMKI